MSGLGQIFQSNPAIALWTAPEQVRWYALHTRARHERVVETRLREQGMETFLPVVQEVHRWSDRKKKVEVPLFSCYVFLRCGMRPQDRAIVQRVDSVLGFVGIRGMGVPIPDEQIESVRAVLAQTSPWRAHPFLKTGQRIRVRGGALDG
ncbi:MAG TPA: transcription termination/antitermination NusG family protein, partial [Terriglobales bacterium]|nr:transcription termination/antitermination NusG family protein [Terriglobales bacterium]